MAVTFPSLEFFQALQKEMRSEKERFSRLGFFDTTFGILELRLAFARQGDAFLE